MKNSLILSVFTILFSLSTFGQSPQAFKYQTVVRDADGNLIQDQNVSFKMGILDLNMNNFQETLEYEETHSVSTNELGLVNLFIGGGTVISGSMSTIDWGQEDHIKYLIIDLDVNGGSNYVSMGNSPLTSVPYALYAESTGAIDEIVNYAGDTKINMPYDDKSIRFISQNIEFMRMTTSGYLGIGTTTPNEKLEVWGSIRMQDGNQGPGKIMVSDGFGTASWTDPSNLGGGAWTVSGNSMYSSVSGNVGIGTTSPGAKLEVAGHISQTGLGNSIFIGEGAGDNDDLSDNKNVFIGYETGNNNTTGSNNIAIGVRSFKYNTTGNQNIAIGSLSLINNTTGFGNVALGNDVLGSNTTGDYNYATGEFVLYNNTTGSFNIAIGVRALMDNTEGSHNIANGYFSLHNNTTGNDNIAFGKSSLINNTAGNNNIATGKNALYSNTTGHSNVAIGVSALLQNTNQSNNVAIGDSALYHNGEGTSSNYAIKNTAVGSKALYSNTSGRRNTANGYESLYSNTGGWYNNAYGNDALYSNAMGSNNNAMGDAALYSNTSGTGNVALGTSSLYNNIAGEFNTALGYHSGLNSTGSNNVFVGKTAGYYESGSNKLYIENSYAGSNDALIYGEFDNDILRFNAKLQISQSSGMVIINDDQWQHYSGMQDFGGGGEYFIMASEENKSETAGIFGDGNNLTLWSAGDAASGQPSAYLYILDEDQFDNNDTDPYNNNALKAYVNTSGNWVSVSDKNKKENIKPLESSLSKLMNINAYSYSLKQSDEEKSKGTNQETTLGVLAQEVEQVFPEVIEKSDAGDYFVSYSEFIPVLIDAVKEQQQTIEELRQSIETLKGEVNQLKKN